MQNGYKAQHWLDKDSNPAGGCSYGTGFTISWQNGPLGRDADRIEPNGAFVEDVISAVIDRIGFYQDSRFNCARNAVALTRLTEALFELEERTKNREERKVGGTHKE